MAPPGNPRAAFAARGRGPYPACPDESNRELARRGRRFRRLSVDRELPVLFANPKAEDLVRRQTGLRYERGQLAAGAPALTHRLHALARAGSRPGGAVGENRPPLLAHVIPLAASRAAAVFDIDWPAAAVFVVDPAAGLSAQIQRFASRFGLTIAETRVLGEIIGGDGLLAAATKLNITEATARTHAAHSR